MCQRCVFAHLFYKANIVIFLKKTNYLLHIFAVILIWNPAYNPMIKSSRTIEDPGAFYHWICLSEVRNVDIPPQTCCLLIRATQCRDTAELYHIESDGVCWHPRDAADDVALLD